MSKETKEKLELQKPKIEEPETKKTGTPKADKRREGTGGRMPDVFYLWQQKRMHALFVAQAAGLSKRTGICPRSEAG